MNLKKNLFPVLLGVVSISVFLVGCTIDSDSGKLHEVYKYSKGYWGEWIRMDTGAVWYITSNGIEGRDAPGGEIILQSKRVIEGTMGNGQKYYLYASRVPNGSFNGKMVGYSNEGKSVSRAVAGGKGFINVVVENLNEKKNSTTVTTDKDGNFTADNIIPGDEYKVIAEGKTTTVTPNTDGEDVGTITVTNGVNFKTSITSTSDLMALYADGTNYTFGIEVTNVDDTDTFAPTYTLKFPDEIAVVSQPSVPILATIEPGKKREIPIVINCPPAAVESEYEYKKIDIEITGRYNKTWNDSVSLKFNQDKVTFNIRSISVIPGTPGVISGIIIVPGAKAYPFKTSYNSESDSYLASVTVPGYSKDYLVVFSGATADTEAAYSLGLDIPAHTVAEFSGFTGTTSYELNNTENTATRLTRRTKIMSYLSKNDIDYYVVNMGH
jgi:hypothetical protein